MTSGAQNGDAQNGFESLARRTEAALARTRRNLESLRRRAAARALASMRLDVEDEAEDD